MILEVLTRILAANLFSKCVSYVHFSFSFASFRDNGVCNKYKLFALHYRKQTSSSGPSGCRGVTYSKIIIHTGVVDNYTNQKSLKSMLSRCVTLPKRCQTP